MGTKGTQLLTKALAHIQRTKIKLLSPTIPLHNPFSYEILKHKLFFLTVLLTKSIASYGLSTLFQENEEEKQHKNFTKLFSDFLATSSLQSIKYLEQADALCLISCLATSVRHVDQ